MGTWPHERKTWLNNRSWITQDEMFTDYVQIINKIGAILYDDTYAEDTKRFARSVLEFAIDHEFITWKQANALLKIKTTADRRLLYYNSTSISKRPYIYAKSQFTDREHDRLCEQIFGDSTRAEELDGYVKSYRSDGSRYFALPN